MIRIIKHGEVPLRGIFSREKGKEQTEAVVAEIIQNVRENGDAALFAYCEQFDRSKLDALEAAAGEIDAAMEAVEPRFLNLLERAAANIRAFHARQVREGFLMSEQEGVLLGQRVLPIERVGLYVPGGTAAYPSTVLMAAIPAKLAGCREIVIATPPREGKVNPAILAAARIAGVDRVFKVGGAQAIAALAYGTQTVPAVDKIVGPGNAYVSEAKRQVFGKVAIDMIAGPSEILVIADAACAPSVAAADLLSQAEHDRLARAVLITDSMDLAQRVAEELERQTALLPRREIARAALEANGKIIVTADIDAAIDIANEVAPEHLELCVDRPFAYLGKIRNAGSVFLGRHCPEVLGDYFAGPNHTLPTGGTARFSSPLSVDDFVKKSQFIYYSEDALHKVKDDLAFFAEQEGLSAHARSVTARFRED